MYFARGRKRTGASPYSSRAWAIHPIGRAMANIASPASTGIAATWPIAASAASTFGSTGTRALRCRQHAVDGRHRPGPAARSAEHVEEHDRSRVAMPVDRVPEAREPAVQPQCLGDGGRRSARARGGVVHRSRATAGTTVQGSAQGSEARTDHRVRIGARRRSHSRRQRRCRQLVIDQQHERRVDQRHQFGPSPAGAERRPQPTCHGAAQRVVPR